MYPCSLFSTMSTQPARAKEADAAPSSDTIGTNQDLTSFASIFTHQISPTDHQVIPDFSDQNIKTTKKRRNQPGHPDPESEVIALSPKTLMATNRYVCEICNKGFQRDQNLQLHRRGHNLPWKLKHKTAIDGETKKKVYVCPEPSCVHHNPSRALGDLTGIKKHFSRKHGEKKWKCDRCGKRYAVQSDWKAHVKTCGSREYKCDCGTLFARKDSFITHRAFCDALAEESARFLSSSTTTTPDQSNSLFPPFSSNPNSNPNPNLLLKPLSASSTAPLPATSLLQIASNMGPITSGLSVSSAGNLAMWQINSGTRNFLGFDPTVGNECAD
ncbi:hypothetical protein LUZ60_006683 [Juncus effusus]|nr:hypothetical protein LUZ60_006683 [Juncus effusus]